MMDCDIGAVGRLAGFASKIFEATMSFGGSILKSERIEEIRSAGQPASLPVYPLRL
jgi:hypothetical protein